MGEPKSRPYKLEELKAKPKIGPEDKTKTFDENLVQLFHSFGYQCVGSPNICVIDAKTAVLAAGGTVILLDLVSKQQKYLPTVSGNGIGHIVVHPNRKHFAVGEKGNQPSINFFTLPALKLSKMLCGGTERAYCFLQFNPSGELLASVGGPPDYSLTVWRWEKEAILLRIKAFSQDVWSVTFSLFLHDQLTTTGVGHIRFWKMASSFTGLKLQGEIGRFGKLEISDIHGCVHLSDGKIVCGSEWGFILIWDEGMVIAQVRRTNGKPCHIGEIYQLLLREGELVSVGADGWLRVWDIEHIENADPEEEGGFIEFDPLDELLVSKKAHLFQMVPSGSLAQKDIWYAQDITGSIWRIDLSFSVTAKHPEVVLKCPGIKITGCDMCPVYPLLAVCAMDGSVVVLDCNNKTKLCSYEFSIGATSLIWPCKKVDGIGASLFVGFYDGTLRWLSLASGGVRKHKLLLQLAIKPHISSISHLSINDLGTTLVTSSLDHTIFFFNIGMSNLVPLGYINIDHVVRWIVWAKYKEEDEEEDDELETKKVSSCKTKDKVDTTEEIILIGCEGSCLIGITAPDQSSLGDDRLSFLIEDACSQLYTIESMRLYYELAYPKEEIVEGEIVEDAELEGEIEETEELVAPEIVLPEIEELPREPPEVLLCYPSNNSGHIWLSLGEDDTGFLFEYPLTRDPENHPVNLIPVRAVELCAAEKQSVLSICVSPCGEFVFMGQADGALSVYSLEDKFDLCSIVEYWKYGFHDSQLGPIRFTHISPDGKLIATIGDDCNIFLYKFKPPRDRKRAEIALSDVLPHLDRDQEVVDIKGEDTLSIEEAYQKSKEVEHLKKMKEKRELISKDIENLIEQLNVFKQEINVLPSSLQLNIQEIIMHSRIKADLITRFKSNVQKVHNEMAWRLEWHSLALKKLCDRFKKFILQERTVIRSYYSGEEVYGFRVHTLPVELAYDTEQEAASEGKKPEEIIEEDKGAVSEVESRATLVFTASSAWEEVQWPPEMIMTKAQLKYIERKKEKLERDKEWAELNACKPESECSLEEDEVIKLAKQTLGDFKLKTDSDYVVPAHLRLNATKKRDQILDFYRRIHSRKKDFNNKIFVLEETWKRLNNLKSEMEKGNGKVIFQDANQDVVADSKGIESKLNEKNISRRKNDNIEKAKEITRQLTFFDAELHLLRIAQCKYCTEIKYADCRYVNMIQELGILKRSDEEERTLENNIALKKQELSTLNQKMENADIVITDSQRLIEIKKTEGYENYTSFLKELGEGHKYANFLTRLFKKKIPQVRRERDEEEEESESEESYSDDDYSSDEETPGKIITEADIEPILLNAVTKHQEIRQQIDDVIKKEQNEIEIMKKEKDMTKKKIRTVETSLLLAHVEMEHFQVKKQGELNKLQLVIILHFNQIMELNISKLPGLLNELLVFSDPVLKALNTRVRELQKESTYLKQQQREIIHQHHQLNMAGHILENNVTRLKEISYAEKMQKFGQDVDLDFLDDLENNPHAAVLRFKKEQLHNSQEKEIQLLNNNIERKKVEVAEITKHNSRLTNLLVELKKEKNALNEQLERRRKQFV